MKRLISLLILFSLLLAGCGEKLKEPVTFYYVRAGYESDMTSIIDSELRESSGHRGDLSYLLALYFMGPADEELLSPLPEGTSIVSVSRSGASITLHLSDTSDSITDNQFTLACSCLTLTCLELTDAESVTIISGHRSVTMNADTMLLQDLTTANYTEESK